MIAPMTNRINMIRMYSNNVLESEALETSSLGVIGSNSQESSSMVASGL